MLLEPPVTPDGPTAQKWAADELANPVYHQSESLLVRLIRWVMHLFEGLPSLGVPSGLAALLVVAGLAVVVLVALWVAGPVRRSRAATRERRVLGHDDRRTAAQLSAAADAAAAIGDWSLAVAERFRAVVRDLEERAVLDERPGRTALEVSATAGRVLPGAAQALGEGALLFDDVVYGERAAVPADDAAMRAVEQHTRSARRAQVSA